MPFDGIVTRAVTEELKQQLLPGKITKIYQPTLTEIVFTIRSHGSNHTLLFSIHPTYARFHLTNDSYQNPAEAPMFCMVLRKHLSGAIIEEISQHGMERIVEFSIKTRNEIGDITHKTLIMELMGKHSNVMLVDKEKGHIVDSLKHVSMAQNRHRTILPGNEYQLPPLQDKWDPLQINGEEFIKKIDFNAGKVDQQIVNTLTGFSPFIAKELVNRTHLGSATTYVEKFTELQTQMIENQYEPAIYRDKKEDFHVIPLTNYSGEKKTYATTNEMLDTFYSGKAERDRVKQQAKDLYRFIKNEKDKNIRKLKKHNQTIKKAEGAEKFQKLGELLTAHIHIVRPGADSVEVTDYYDPEGGTLTIELNQNKTASDNAQGYYKTYQKLKKSKQVIEKEILKTNEEIAYFDQLLQQLDVAATEDIEEIREELQEEGYLRKQAKKKKQKTKQSKPVPEAYTSSDGTAILVGKNNKQNEYVTMKLARRDDIWLHTKDIPGSHVIIRDSEPSEETLSEAAQIAAYFSKSQQSSSVPVDYTLIRHVKKPNGAKPGYVTYDNQKTLYVTPDANIVEKLKSPKSNG
ncbi:Rqc2 family fibronectin-binding protein [Oceanobacillus manasiensis]|uniref:Rqc2 family fibronectin-binding protein n=1 Tax=Oceanobacillus manasiensis TaxID=586413 RepID=UPI0005AB5A37|nr:NFACT RNA binding domain-containing protein [Oceanobacillus manasiensis]